MSLATGAVRLLDQRGSAFNRGISSSLDAYIKDDKGTAALQYAASQGFRCVLRGLISRGVPVDARNTKGETALFVAVIYNQMNSLLVLIEFGSDVDSQRADGARPLCIAVINGLQEVVRLLLEAGANPNIIDPKSRQSPLMTATLRHRIDISELLLANGADATATCAKRRTCLHIAAFIGATRFCLALVDAGAQVNSQDCMGTTPIALAAICHQEETYKCLLSLGADPLLDDGVAAWPGVIGASDSVARPLRGFFLGLDFLCSRLFSTATHIIEGSESESASSSHTAVEMELITGQPPAAITMEIGVTPGPSVSTGEQPSLAPVMSTISGTVRGRKTESLESLRNYLFSTGRQKPAQAAPALFTIAQGSVSESVSSSASTAAGTELITGQSTAAITMKMGGTPAPPVFMTEQSSLVPVVLNGANGTPAPALLDATPELSVSSGEQASHALIFVGPTISVTAAPPMMEATPAPPVFNSEQPSFAPVLGATNSIAPAMMDVAPAPAVFGSLQPSLALVTSSTTSTNTLSMVDATPVPAFNGSEQSSLAPVLGATNSTVATSMIHETPAPALSVSEQPSFVSDITPEPSSTGSEQPSYAAMNSTDAPSSLMDVTPGPPVFAMANVSTPAPSFAGSEQPSPAPVFLKAANGTEAPTMLVWTSAPTLSGSEQPSLPPFLHTTTNPTVAPSMLHVTPAPALFGSEQPSLALVLLSTNSSTSLTPTQAPVRLAEKASPTIVSGGDLKTEEIAKTLEIVPTASRDTMCHAVTVTVAPHRVNGVESEGRIEDSSRDDLGCPQQLSAELDGFWEVALNPAFRATAASLRTSSPFADESPLASVSPSGFSLAKINNEVRSGDFSFSLEASTPMTFMEEADSTSPLKPGIGSNAKGERLTDAPSKMAETPAPSLFIGEQPSLEASSSPDAPSTQGVTPAAVTIATHVTEAQAWTNGTLAPSGSTSEQPLPAPVLLNAVNGTEAPAMLNQTSAPYLGDEGLVVPGDNVTDLGPAATTRLASMGFNNTQTMTQAPAPGNMSVVDYTPSQANRSLRETTPSPASMSLDLTPSPVDTFTLFQKANTKPQDPRPTNPPANQPTKSYTDESTNSPTHTPVDDQSVVFPTAPYMGDESLLVPRDNVTNSGPAAARSASMGFTNIERKTPAPVPYDMAVMMNYTPLAASLSLTETTPSPANMSFSLTPSPFTMFQMANAHATIESPKESPKHSPIYQPTDSPTESPKESPTGSWKSEGTNFVVPAGEPSLTGNTAAASSHGDDGDVERERVEEMLVADVFQTLGARNSRLQPTLVRALLRMLWIDYPEEQLPEISRAITDRDGSIPIDLFLSWCRSLRSGCNNDRTMEEGERGTMSAPSNDETLLMQAADQEDEEHEEGAKKKKKKGTIVKPCVVCGKNAYRRCSKCKVTFFCGPECHLPAWKGHQAECIALQDQAKAAHNTD